MWPTPDAYCVGVCIRIPDHSDPRGRMVAIVRYYLSSFHAARKGAVAKKPYNPILGEIFRCYWDLPDSTRASPSDEAKVVRFIVGVVYIH